ncbi:unnamed protein product [Adineta ricciae]|uniref:Chitin-binding type-2 domain-containing protein n=1 Tax=Adineta ricciae TaxID=249248 RepID=A0A814VXZ4_ADIRI|nr:unnamed protein product [Adineta ricciae]
MQLLIRFKRPCDFFSSGYAILVIVCLSMKDTALAEYDCSAKDDGWYYDPEFCHIYWRCTHGSAEEFECASGTAWDHTANRCNWLDSVDCSRAEKTTPKISSEEEEEETTNEENEEEDEAPSEQVIKSKKKKKKTTSNKRMLDDEDDETDHTTTSRKKSSTESSSSESNKASTLPPTHGKYNSILEGFECQLTGFYAVPDPTQCNSYYQCDRGVQTRLSCPEKQLYDEEKRQCMDFDRVNCGTRAVNLADKNQCVNKRDGIHPDTERGCHYYYQCASHNKLREAKCPGDEKFSSYTSRCGPASSAPVPCGTYVLGSATMPYHRNLGYFISFLLATIYFTLIDL